MVCMVEQFHIDSRRTGNDVKCMTLYMFERSSLGSHLLNRFHDSSIDSPSNHCEAYGREAVCPLRSFHDLNCCHSSCANQLHSENTKSSSSWRFPCFAVWYFDLMETHMTKTCRHYLPLDTSWDRSPVIKIGWQHLVGLQLIMHIDITLSHFEQ